MTSPLTDHHVIDTQAMYRADAAAIQRGVSGFELMCRAAKAVVDAANQERLLTHQVIVICGQGNNGGDGFVVAHLLRESGHSVNVVFAGSKTALEQLTGDAKQAADLFCSKSNAQIFCVYPSTDTEQSGLIRLFDSLASNALVIDALFGAGLNRALAVELLPLIELVNRCSSPCLSVDLPSGVLGDSGRVVSNDGFHDDLELAVNADLTVTFFKKKPGHLLEPGKSLCGKVVVCDIGIADDVLTARDSVFVENTPASWIDKLPRLTGNSHKYNRGHVLVLSGPRHATGAARLAANAALRAGAGLVSLASPEDALDVNAMHLTEIMQYHVDTARMLDAVLSDTRLNVLVIGPGYGVGPDTVKMTLTALRANRACVIDADALTAFRDSPEVLFDAIHQCHAPVVLTPHHGEFKRLFANLDQLAKHERASEAARTSGATIVLKGSDTVIADPNGSIAVNSNAPGWLATAGSGDVLAGTIAGLLAQGSDDGFSTSCASVWMHGDAASRHGPGLIASDIDTYYPDVLRHLLLLGTGITD